MNIIKFYLFWYSSLQSTDTYNAMIAMLHSLLWPPVKMFPSFAPQATDLHAKTGGRDTTSSGVADLGKNLQAEAVQN